MSLWTITWGGHSWTDDDLTGQHLGTLAVISGDDRFESLQIDEEVFRAYPTEGYMRLMNMIAALAVVEATDESMGDAQAAEVITKTMMGLRAASADDILGAITFSH